MSLTRWCLAAGRSRIKLKSTGEVFTINPCNVKANNVIVGSTWVDNEGDYALINTTTGARADMYFTPCGWWGNGRYQVRLAAAPGSRCCHPDQHDHDWQIDEVVTLPTCHMCSTQES